jgi:signal transduction histidine kinase
MQFKKATGLASLILSMSIAPIALAIDAETATPDEVIAKVRQAANHLYEKGNSAFAEFNAKSSAWVWKDSYVFIYDCQQDKMIAHPFRPDLVDRPILQIKDSKGTPLFQKLCEAGKQENGGWVEYYWDKPGEAVPSRKISYALAAKVSFKVGVQVGAGIYDDKVTTQQLSELLAKMSDPTKFPAP